MTRNFRNPQILPRQLEQANANKKTAVDAGPRQSVSTAELFLFLFPLALIGYAASYSMLEMYVLGDRSYYIDFFNSIEFVDLSEVSEIQYSKTGSREPIYGFLMWIASGSIDNIVYISIFNSLLIFLMGYMAIIYRLNVIVYPLYFTNFYLLVVMTGAERLKFSLIFLLLFICVKRNIRYAFLVCAPAAHIQTVIIYITLIAPTIMFKSSNLINNNVKYKKLIRNLILAASLAMLLMFVILYQDYIVNKALAYMDSENNILMISSLVIASAITFRKNFVPTISLLPLIFAVLILGGSRVNMIGFVVYFYYVVTLRKSLDPAFLVIMMYLSFKSIGFVDNIIQTGNGFGQQ